MGFFEGFRRPNPDVDRLVELKKQQMQAEAAEVLKSVRTQADAKMAKMNADHAARMAPVEASIAKHKSDRERMFKNALLNSHCMSLMMGLYNPLSNAARVNATDRISARKKLRGDIEKGVEVIKADPTKKNLEAFQAWALDQVQDEQGKAAVQKEFDKFMDSLNKDSISLG